MPVDSSAFEWESMAGALHAAVNAVSQCDNRTLPRPILRELPPNPDRRHGIGLCATPQMTILTSEAIASEVFGPLCHVGPI